MKSVTEHNEVLIFVKNLEIFNKIITVFKNSIDAFKIINHSNEHKVFKIIEMKELVQFLEKARFTSSEIYDELQNIEKKCLS